MSSTWNKLVNLVIRPPRAQYDPNEHLPGPRFRIAGVTHVRRDIDLAGADGLTLKCSHYEPEVRGNDPLPCVIYLHGNSGSDVTPRRPYVCSSPRASPCSRWTSGDPA